MSRRSRKAAADPNRGPRFRARRMGLGVRSDRLGLPERVVFRMPWVEDGTEDPDCGWDVLDARLAAALEAFVSERMWGGQRWQDIRISGWTALEISAAAATVMAEL